MIDQNWVFLAVSINLVGAIVYAYSVVKGSTRPNRVTWFILSFAPLLAFADSDTFDVRLQAFGVPVYILIADVLASLFIYFKIGKPIMQMFKTAEDDLIV